MLVYRQEDGVPGGDYDNNDGKCELLGPFALFVQGALGLLALLSLVWKRSREHPQRPLKIWFFDASKQVVGGTMVHMANLLLSMISSGSFSSDPTKHLDEDNANPCSFYLLNLAIDTTIGIGILILILRLINKLLVKLDHPFFNEGMQSGVYGNPPKWIWWAKQSFVYFTGLMGMKLVVYLIFVIFPWLGAVGDWLLSWSDGDRRLQVFFVMFFFPLVMNAFQYYVIDSFIKATNLDFTSVANSPRASFDSTFSYSSDEESRPTRSSSGLLSPTKRPEPKRSLSSPSNIKAPPSPKPDQSASSTEDLTLRSRGGAATPTSFTTRVPLRTTKSSGSTPKLGRNARADFELDGGSSDEDEAMEAWGVRGGSL